MHFYAFFNHFYCALFSLYRSWANCSKFDFVSSLVALHSLSHWAPSLPKCRFAQERRVIEQFQRAMRPALIYITVSMIKATLYILRCLYSKVEDIKLKYIDVKFLPCCTFIFSGGTHSKQKAVFKIGNHWERIGWGQDKTETPHTDLIVY